MGELCDIVSKKIKKKKAKRAVMETAKASGVASCLVFSTQTDNEAVLGNLQLSESTPGHGA